MDDRLGATAGAAFVALTPATTALLGIPLLGEWPSALLDLPVIACVAEKAKDTAQGGSEWATHMVGAAGDKVRGAADKTAARTEQTAEGIAEKAKGAADHATEWVDQATETIADMASGAGDATQRVREQANRLGADIARSAQEQPLAALLIAGAVGYVLAYLLHGRR